MDNKNLKEYIENGPIVLDIPEIYALLSHHYLSNESIFPDLTLNEILEILGRLEGHSIELLNKEEVIIRPGESEKIKLPTRIRLPKDVKIYVSATTPSSIHRSAGCPEGFKLSFGPSSDSDLSYKLENLQEQPIRIDKGYGVISLVFSTTDLYSREAWQKAERTLVLGLEEVREIESYEDKEFGADLKRPDRYTSKTKVVEAEDDQWELEPGKTYMLVTSEVSTPKSKLGWLYAGIEKYLLPDENLEETIYDSGIEKIWFSKEVAEGYDGPTTSICQVDGRVRLRKGQPVVIYREYNAGLGTSYRGEWDKVISGKAKEGRDESI